MSQTKSWHQIMRVLLISHVDNLYGAGRSLLSLASGLRRGGHEVRVVIPGEGELTHALLDVDIDTVQVNCPWWAYPKDATIRQRLYSLKRTFSIIKTLKAVITEFQPDIVHTNSLVISAGAVAARICHVPHIWHIREFGREDYDLRFLFGRKVSAFLVGKLSRSVIAISQTVAKTFAPQIGWQRIRVVYNGVDWPKDMPVKDAGSHPYPSPRF